MYWVVANVRFQNACPQISTELDQMILFNSNIETNFKIVSYLINVQNLK